MSEGPDYVCFSGMDWWYHSHAHADFQLMRRIARTRKVLFVNTIGLRVPVPGRTDMIMRRILRKARSVAKLVRRPESDLPNLYVMSPLSLPASGRGRAWNARMVYWQVRLVSLLVGIREPVVIVTIPTAGPVVDLLPHRKLLYNRCDKHSNFPEANQTELAALERALLTKADTTLYVNRRLMADEADLTGDRAYFLDHGVDLDLFTPRDASEVPDDLAAIPQPRIGFIGAIRDYTVDLDLILRTAQDLPEVQIVLVGDATCSLDRFEGVPNIHWLGPRPHQDVPRYAAGLDVALMPWLQNEWIDYCNPIKLKEYLALGLPVVSTPFGDGDHYREWIRIAGSVDDFVAAVERTLEDRGPGSAEQRRDTVADAPWDRRAEQVMSLAEGR